MCVCVCVCGWVGGCVCLSVCPAFAGGPFGEREVRDEREALVCHPTQRSGQSVSASSMKSNGGYYYASNTLYGVANGD